MQKDYPSPFTLSPKGRGKLLNTSHLLAFSVWRDDMSEIATSAALGFLLAMASYLPLTCILFLLRRPFGPRGERRTKSLLISPLRRGETSWGGSIPSSLRFFASLRMTISNLGRRQIFNDEVAAQLDDAVAQQGRPLEVQVLGGLLHLLFQLIHQPGFILARHVADGVLGSLL